MSSVHSELVVARPANFLLSDLPLADLESLGPHLRPVELTCDTVLVESGRSLAHVYFPHSCIISLVVSLADGRKVETAMVGRGTVLGASAVLDGPVSLNDALVELSGAASMLEVGRLRTAVAQSPTLRAILVRHEQALSAQVQQSVACHAFHAVEARVACWLLRARDFSGGDTLQLTQELLAQALGVQRNTVSLVANRLQEAGLIHYRRGSIEITDVDRLMESSCECYGTIKTHYDALRSH